MAKELAKAHPEDTPWVAGYAYETYQQPPVQARLEGKIMVGIVAFSSFPSLLNETEGDRRLWSGWRDAGAAGLFLRPNIGGNTVGHVSPRTRILTLFTRRVRESSCFARGRTSSASR